MLDVRNRVLVGDIGGSNARFAFIANDRLGPIESIAVADYPHVGEALGSFIAGYPDDRPILGAVLAVAGVVEKNRCALTNSSWVIDGSELSRMFDLSRVSIVNDFAAIAWSLPQLSSTELFAIGGGTPVPGAPAVVLGPGTGLGLACIVSGPGDAIVIDTEGGHATLPGACAREDTVIAHLRERFGHVSAERVLSGAGLINLYEAIASVDGISVTTRSAAEITKAARDGSCPLSQTALDMFCAMLGTVAGNAALTFGARGGVYIAGGIVHCILDFVTRSQFRARFEAKGRFRAYVATIPSSVIVHPDPAFMGLQRFAKREFV